MKYWLAGCALVVAACGDNANKTGEERVDVPVSVYGAYVVHSFDSAPECMSGKEGRVVYSIEADAYSLCTSTGYQQVSLTAETGGKCKANHVQNGIHIFDCGDSAKYRLQEGSGCVHFDEDSTTMLVCYDSSAVRIPKAQESKDKCSIFKLIPGSPAVKCGTEGFAQIVWSGFESKLTVVLTGNGSPAKDTGAEGDTYLDSTTGYIWIKKDGAWMLEIAKDASWACSVANATDSTYSIKCPDGSSVTLKDGIQGVPGVQGLNGADGASCTVKDLDQSNYSLACGKDTVIVPMGKDGLNGKDGASCTVATDADGIHKLSCPDGTSITIINGLNGANGTSCVGEVVANGIQISCGGEVVDVLTNGLDGLKGDDGKNGTSCLGNVIPEGVQIVCAGVPLDTLTSGVNGLNGESCSARTIAEGIEVTCGASFKDTLTNGTNGANGSNGVSIQWLGTLATAPSTPSLNQAYYNSTDGVSYVWDGDSWEVMAKDGSTALPYDGLLYPDGCCDEVITAGNGYTVPLNKTLYITSWYGTLKLDGHIVGSRGGLDNVIAPETYTVSLSDAYMSSSNLGFSGFLRDESVQRMVSVGYTVPSERTLVVTSSGCSVSINGKTSAYLSDYVVAKADDLVTPNQTNGGEPCAFTGYLMAK